LPALIYSYIILSYRQFTLNTTTFKVMHLLKVEKVLGLIMKGVIAMQNNICKCGQLLRSVLPDEVKNTQLLFCPRCGYTVMEDIDTLPDSMEKYRAGK